MQGARRKAQNEITKTRIDLETKVLHERQDTISKRMGDVLEDLTKAPLDKIEKYVKPVIVAPVAEEAEEEEAEGEAAPAPEPEPEACENAGDGETKRELAIHL